VVHDQSAPNTDSRFDDRCSGVLRVRPGHLRRLQPGDAHSRVSDGGVKLLRSTASTSQHPPSRLGVSATVFQSLVAALVLCRYGNVCHNNVVIFSHHQGLKGLKMLKTFLSRPRPRPRLVFLSSRRLETKTLVSRTTSLPAAGRRIVTHC